MKINKDSFNIYLKIAPYLLLKFTMNILVFSVFVLFVLKFRDKFIYTFFISFVYLSCILFLNILFNKKILYTALNIKNELFLFRKKLLKKYFKKNFNHKEYYKNNLILLLIGMVFFIILALASIPLILMVKKTIYIIIVLILALLFTILFIFNIISPLMLINEYKNLEER